MPIYGKEKARVMGRSILPSTRPAVARWKRQRIHREHRRETNQLVGLYARDPELFDELPVGQFPNHRINRMRRNRRDADKLNHFIRWARVRTKKFVPKDRLSQMKAVLPKGLIGDHAVGHLKFDRDFEDPDLITRWRGAFWNLPPEEKARLQNELPWNWDEARKFLEEAIPYWDLVNNLNSQLSIHTRHFTRKVQVQVEKNKWDFDLTQYVKYLVWETRTEIVRSPEIPKIEGRDSIEHFLRLIADAWKAPKNHGGLDRQRSWSKVLRGYIEQWRKQGIGVRDRIAISY